MDASWVEVLDFLRYHFRHEDQDHQFDPTQGIYGAECVNMTPMEEHFIFGTGWRKWNDPQNQATKFIRGRIQNNPVKDWENGELELPPVPGIEDMPDNDDEIEANDGLETGDNPTHGEPQTGDGPATNYEPQTGDDIAWYW